MARVKILIDDWEIFDINKYKRISPHICLYNNKKINYKLIKIKITCVECEGEFQTSLKNHLIKNNLKCANCNRKETSLKRYGTNTPAENHLIREKTKNYFINKYGTISPGAVKDVKEKIKQRIYIFIG